MTQPIDKQPDIPTTSPPPDGYVEELLHAIDRVPDLPLLDLSPHRLTQNDMQRIAKAIARHSGIHTLHISDIDRDAPGQDAPDFNWLRQLHGLRHLSINHPPSDRNALDGLCDILKDNRTLSSLSLSIEMLPPAEQSRLAEALFIHNRGLTGVLLIGKPSQEFVDIYAEHAGRHNPNFSYVTIDGNTLFYTNPVLANRTAARKITEKLRIHAEDYTGPELREIAQRYNLIFKQGEPAHDQEEAKERFDVLADSLPRLSDAEKKGDNQKLAEALFVPQTHHFTPLDNPYLFTSRDQAVELLGRLPLSPELLRQQTGKGSTLPEALLMVMDGKDLVDTMNGYGLSIGGDMLLKNGNKTSLLDLFLSKHQSRALLSPANTVGMTAAEYRTLYAALPPEAKQAIPAWLQRTTSAEATQYRRGR